MDPEPDTCCRVTRLFLCALVNGDAEVQTHVDDGQQEQQKEGSHQDQGLHHHFATKKSVEDSDPVNYLLFSQYISVFRKY